MIQVWGVTVTTYGKDEKPRLFVQETDARAFGKQCIQESIYADSNAQQVTVEPFYVVEKK